MKTIQFESEIGSDGVLSLRVPVGPVDANARVLVTIQPVASFTRDQEEEPRQDWHDFVRQTYGSCVGLGLEEPPDLPLPAPDWSP